MNEILLIIIAIIVAISSTILVRPNYWKQIFQKMPLPPNYTVSTLVFALGFQVLLGFVLTLNFILGMVNSKLRFFNVFTILAIVIFLTNIGIGNWILTNTRADALKRKNFLITSCVLVVFSILSIILNVQFSKVMVPTTKVESESLEDVLLDETIPIGRKDIVKLANIGSSSYEAYSSNGKIIYWDCNEERNSNTAIILHDKKVFLKEYNKNSPSFFLKSYQKVGFVVDDDDNVYQAFAIIKYKKFKFYIDSYALFDYANDKYISCGKLPTWATNK